MIKIKKFITTTLVVSEGRVGVDGDGLVVRAAIIQVMGFEIRISSDPL